MKKIIQLLLLLNILSVTGLAVAADNFSVVEIKDGVNYLDLNGDGKNDMVVRSWWENNNAHGYYQYTFHIHKSDEEIKRERADKQLDYEGHDKFAAWEARNPSNQVNEWLIVAFEHDGGKLTDSFRTINGADCVLEDIYLLKSEAGGYEVVIAKRPFKESFYEKLKVTFYRYEFVRDDEGLVGYPPNRFVFKGKMTTRNSYCDANEAFEREYKKLVSAAKRPSKYIK